MDQFYNLKRIQALQVPARKKDTHKIRSISQLNFVTMFFALEHSNISWVWFLVCGDLLVCLFVYLFLIKSHVMLKRREKGLEAFIRAIHLSGLPIQLSRYKQYFSLRQQEIRNMELFWRVQMGKGWSSGRKTHWPWQCTRTLL